MQTVLSKVSKPFLKNSATSSLVSRRLYHENIIDHYENPRNVGSLDKNKKNVGTGKRITTTSMKSFDSMFCRIGWSTCLR